MYRAIIFIRQLFYKTHLLKSYKINVPVIIVGNITVGGTGKTPLVIALVHELKKAGWHPGVIAHGYRGKQTTWPVLVNEQSDPILTGDEALLIVKNTGVFVVAGPNRVHDAIYLLQQDPACNVIISDDGLQHTALKRDIEIVVIDGMRRFGNQFCLPAGPLREPMKRLQSVDFVVTNGVAKTGEYAMQFVLKEFINLVDQTTKLDLTHITAQKIFAVAGIGNPERFFELLKSQNLIFEKKVFPDHHAYQKSDFDFVDADAIVLMTEKDAMKCVAFAKKNFFVVKGCAVVDEGLVQRLLLSIRNLISV